MGQITKDKDTIKEIEQYKKMTGKPVPALIAGLALPAIISMLTTMIYNLVDAFFVGRLGTSASAAIGIVMSLQAIFQAFGFMFGHGSGSLIGRYESEGKKDEADRCLSTAFLAGLVVSVILMTAGLIFRKQIVVLMGSIGDIIPYSEAYAFYILAAGPGFVISCILNNVMRYEGKAFYAMIGLVSGGVLNMIGDPIFMFGLGLGIDGAGLSTMISQYISCGILLYMFLSGKTIARISPETVLKKGNRKRILKDVFRIIKTGFPSLIRQGLNSVSTMTLNICAGPYGAPGIAAMTIAGRVMMFMGSVLIGVGQALQPVSAFNYGAKKYKRLRESFMFTWITGTAMMLVMASMGAIFSDRIVRVFIDDPDPAAIAATVAAGTPALRCMCVAIIVQPVSVLSNMIFQSIGRSRVASFIATLRSGICYIPALLILPNLFGIFGLQSSQMIADILASIISAPFIIRFFMKEVPDRDERTAMDEQIDKSLLLE